MSMPHYELDLDHGEQFASIHDRESDITKERIQKIISSGANVILTTGGIDDLCLKYFVEAGAMAVRRCKKADLKRIAKATGGRHTLHFLLWQVRDLCCMWLSGDHSYVKSMC